MRRLLILFLFLMAASARADNVKIVYLKLLTASPAASNHLSTDTTDVTALGKPADTGLFTQGSLQCVWSGLTTSSGPVNSTASLEASDDGVNWVAKSGAQLALAGASGNGIVSLSNISETNYRVNYQAGLVNAGSVSCIFVAKP